MTDSVFLGAICDYFGHDEEVIIVALNWKLIKILRNVCRSIAFASRLSCKLLWHFLFSNVTVWIILLLFCVAFYYNLVRPFACLLFFFYNFSFFISMPYLWPDSERKIINIVLYCIGQLNKLTERNFDYTCTANMLRFKRVVSVMVFLKYYCNITRAVARILFQRRQRDSVGARLLLVPGEGRMVGRGHMANVGARVYNGGLGWAPSEDPGGRASNVVAAVVVWSSSTSLYLE